MSEFLKKYALFFPFFVLLFLCIAEWCLYIWTPYSYFFSRGTQTPNVDYVATTRGDLVAEDIFITKIPRDARYVTDQYGGRNISFSSDVDVLIFGESFGYGAGIGHEHTPAVQLSKLTEYSVAVAPQLYDPFVNKNQIEKALHVVNHHDPVKPKFIILIYIDSLLWNWNHEYDFKEMIEKSNKDMNQKSVFSKVGDVHNDVKNYISNYSPITIISRKLKSYIKVNLKKTLNYFSMYSLNDKKHYQTNNGIIGFSPIPDEINISDLRNHSLKKLSKLANTHKELYDLGQKKNIVILPLIVPDKTLAYYNEINGKNYYSEFPGVILENYIRSLSIPVVSVYSEYLDAIHSEFTKNGDSVYWGDDTHWNALGIKIAMSKLGEEIKKINNSVKK